MSLLKYVIEGKIEGRIEVTAKRERRCKQLLDDLKEKTGYWKWKGRAIHGLWKRLSSCCKTGYRMNEWMDE